MLYSKAKSWGNLSQILARGDLKFMGGGGGRGGGTDSG